MTLPKEIIKIIKESKTIAVVGASRHEEKAAHTVPKYLQEQGYQIIPVNPFAEQILGQKAHRSLEEITEKIDIVQIFRPSKETPDIVKEAIKLEPRIIWLQLGIKNKQAAEIAEKNKITIVMDKCLFQEHRKLKQQKLL
jgi:hypothetical protein